MTITLTKPGTTGQGEGTYVEGDGTLRYFYRDPDTTSGGTNFATVMGMEFSLSKHKEQVIWTAGATIYWDANKVQTALGDIAHQLTWDAIKGSNSQQDQVTKALSLPLVVDGKAWATITWNFDIDGILDIPAARPGNSAPLSATIITPEFDTPIELTATVRFNLTASNEEAIEVTCTIPLTVTGSGINNGELMQSNLQTHYTLEKIKDSVTKEVINAEEVTGDIILPTPANTGVPGYSAYRFTAESKDEDVLCFQAYRGTVYRPLPGQAPWRFTLPSPWRAERIQA